MSFTSDRKRRAELAKIHIAKAQLGLDDETYRQILWTIARVDSSANLDSNGRAKLLEHFKSRGFVDRKKDSTKLADDPQRPKTVSTNFQIKKIEALLGSNGLSWAYAHGIALRMHHRERVEFCDPQQLRSIIAALAYHDKRHNAGKASKSLPTHELASVWFADAVALRQLCGDAQSKARGERAEHFTHEMMLNANQRGLELLITEAQLKWLCQLANRVMPLRITTTRGNHEESIV